MSDSTKALMLKTDGTVVEDTFFTDNAAALNAAVTGGGGGGGAVASVNGQTGTVVLAAADVGAPTTAALTDGLALKAAATRNINTANSLQGGGDLTGDRTLQLVGDENAPAANKVYGTAADGTRGWQTLADILPSYVDDVIEAANFAALPGTGETGKIYVTLDTNLTYRWSGSAYVIISSSPAMADQSEAEAGTDNATTMTPLRTAQAIAAQAAPKARSVSAAGLATGGGDLSADRTITVPIASQAEAEAGTDNAKAMTPLRAAEAIAALAGAAVFVGYGTLQGYTDAGSDAVPATPASAIFSSSSSGSDGEFVTINVNGVDYVFEFDPSADGVADGHISVPSSTPADIVTAINGSALGAIVTASTADVSDINLTALTAGTGTVINGISSASPTITGGAITAGTDGSAAVPPSGAVSSIELIPAKTGKTLIPIAFLAQVGGATGLNGVDVLILRPGTLATLNLGDGQPALDLLSSGMALGDIVAASAGQPVTAVLSGTIPIGGSASFMIAAIAV